MNNKEVEQTHNKRDREFRRFLEKEHPNYVKEHTELRVIAIGYLTADKSFITGNVPNGFLDKLRTKWNEGTVLSSLGSHECELCNPPTPAKSSSEKTLIDKEHSIKYVFPKMIFHYIEIHKFLPEQHFVDFIMKTE